MMRFNHQLELNQTLTTLYLIIEVGRWDAAHAGDLKIRQHMCKLIDYLNVRYAEWKKQHR